MTLKTNPKKKNNNNNNILKMDTIYHALSQVR